MFPLSYFLRNEIRTRSRIALGIIGRRQDTRPQHSGSVKISCCRLLRMYTAFESSKDASNSDYKVVEGLGTEEGPRILFA